MNLSTRALIAGGIVLSMLMLVGCGGGGVGTTDLTERAPAADSAVGSWQIYSQVNPTLIDVACKSDHLDDVRLNINDDGSLEFVEYAAGAVVARSAGTWTWDGDHAEATWEGCNTSLRLDRVGDSLIVLGNDGTPNRIEMHMERI